MEPWLGIAVIITDGLHAVCMIQACPIRMMVTILIHVSLYKSIDLTRQVITWDALPHIKCKCNRNLQMHTAMLTSTSEAKPCRMEVPLSGISPKFWHNSTLPACLHAFVREPANSTQLYEHRVKLICAGMLLNFAAAAV